MRAAGLTLPAAAAHSSLCLATSPTLYPPLLEKFISKLDPAADDFVCEQYAAGIQPVLDLWSSSVRNSARNADAVLLHLSESLRACSLVPSKTIPLRTAPPLETERRTFGNLENIGREKFIVE